MRIIVRGIGPSLAVNGTPVQGRLADPSLELFDANGVSLAANDNWRTDEAAVVETGLPPDNDFEAAIVARLPSGAFTVHLRGTDNSSGIGLLEMYQLDSGGSPAR